MTTDDLYENNILEFANATDIMQFSVEAGEEDEFFIDDIFFV